MTAAPVAEDIFDEGAAQPPVYFDRTTAEHYATCPFMAHAIETGLVLDANPAMDAGGEAHEALAVGLDRFAHEGEFDIETVVVAARQARPDVQPEVIEGLRRGLWLLRTFLTDRNPADLLRYQGGQGERSGQLGRELLPATATRGPVIATAELDMLLATRSPNELADHDFKTGRTIWCASSINAAFQFQMHNWLIRGCYEGIEQVTVTVWMPRLGMRTGAVAFSHADADAFAERLAGAWQAREQAHSAAAAGEDIPAWPSHDKCSTCPAVMICPRATKPAIGLNTDPIQYAADTQCLWLAVNQRLTDLRRYVDAHGDIQAAGLCFGLNKPRTPRKPRADQYTFYTPNEQTDDATDGER